MEVRSSRGRGGSGKRGGRGGNDGDSHGGEHRGRGRGGHHHRARGKRDHYRGRGGRGSGGHAADFRRDHDEGDFQDDDDAGVRESFSRRKLECNWNRYEASEKEEADEDTPTQRGTDYSVLLQSAGDSFTQFRFSDEKDWEMDSFVAGQMSVLVDLASLAQSLQQVPLHHRLNLQQELIQISTPLELPTQLPPKTEISQTSTFTPPSTTSKVTVTTPIRSSIPSASSKTVESLEEDLDEELDQLLSLDKPVSASGHEANAAVHQEESAPEKVCEEVKKDVPKVVEKEDKMAEVKDTHVSPTPVKKELTEEDLEDWLDSMIS